ncbi:MAG TPA: VWA domain-containing protein, partial [Polyangiaceae bacterium]
LLVLIDTSASMTARENTTSRFELARSALLAHVAALPETTEVLLLTADAQTVPLIPWTRDRDSLMRAIRRVRPGEAISNFPLSLATAAEYVANRHNCRLLVVTDGTIADWESLRSEPGLTNVPIEAITVGSEALNVGITHVGARLQPDSPRFAALLVNLINSDLTQHEVSLEITSRGQRLTSRALVLGPRQQKTIHLSELEARHHVFEVRVALTSHERDALSLDDVAHAVLPQTEKTRVAVVTHGNLYLEAAVLSDEFIDARFLPPETAFDSANVDAAIYDGIEPPAPLLVPSLVINPPVGSTRFQVGETITQAGFDTWDHGSPWLRDLDLYDVQIDHGHALLPSAGDQALAYSGRRALLTSGQREGHPFVAIGFNVSQSDFVLRPIWPLFVRQVLEQLLGRSVAEVRETRPWQAISMPAKARASKLQILGPGGHFERIVAAGSPWWFLPDRVGLYETVDTEHRSYVATNLGSSNESRIQTLRPLTYAGRSLQPPREASRMTRPPPLRSLAIVALILLVAEWFAFHRRWTT